MSTEATARRVPKATVPGPDGLTDRQREIHRLIYESARDRGYQPSFAEMAAEMGVSSMHGIVCHLVALARKGYLDYEPGRYGARCLRILKTPDGVPFRGFRNQED